MFTQYEAPLSVDLDAEDEDEEIELKKKKPKKNVFYGKKTRKGFTRTGYGEKATLELFRYLKVYEDPVPYVRDVYWYDFGKKKIVKSRKIDKGNAGILHGPYERKRGDVVIESGIYFMGVKHGRWMKWDRHDILIEKEKYYKGWPKESMVAYHDRKTRKIEEIIPVHYGEKEGNYYAFHKSGNLAATGEFQFDNKVGLWREFYDIRNRRKREIIYSEDPFDKTFRPYIIREWDNRGKLIYENKKK
ncbi:MAG: hypothetical protein JXR07_18935 [Reichenbachiella sp.]